jgi:hypothetical protein
MDSSIEDYLHLERAAAGFEAHSVPGDHVSIFSESNAPVLAAELERVLRNFATRADPVQLTAASC